VNSSRASELRGYVEVAGQRAEVIIANPSGIVVNGGGFINASAATLTTGTPQFSGNTLTGYLVTGGTITVSGAGLDASTIAATTLQAQRIMLQGGIWAQDLRIVGDNSAGTANAVAIDVASIGGMYANKITLLANGQGAGVNNAGVLQANSGPFTLSADGSLTNTGTLDSNATTRINATKVNNSTAGAIYGGSVAIAATTLNNAAAASTDTAPVIAARDTTGRVDMGVQTLNNQEGALIYSAGTLNIGGALDSNSQATGRATTVTNNSATLEAAGNVGITTQNFANTYTSLSYRTEVDPNTPAVSGSESCGSGCTRAWTDTFYRAVAIEGPHGAALLRSGADILLNASISATNSSSQILAAGTLTATGATLNNHGIDLTSQVATRRDNHVAQEYIVNNVGCIINFLGIRVGCRSETRVRHSYSTDLIARDQTIAPATAQSNTISVSTTPALPNSALFSTSANPAYLIQTDPRFTNKHIWLSSDYMLSLLTVDPDTTQKRMGDGFYEQRLINEQIARLTGYARLANYASDEQQYQALMSAGITFAHAHQLRVGIALTAAQVAQLTSDMVWLVQREVTLADGSTQKVLVPQVYAVARAGDLSGTGALLSGVLSGNMLSINTTGDITNANGATLAGRELVTMTAANVRNLGARIQGKDVQLNASQDIENTGGAVIAQNSLNANAGRDIIVRSTTQDSSKDSRSATNTPSNTAPVSKQSGGLAGGVSVGGFGGGSSELQTRSTDISRVAGLYVTADAGTLLVSAGRDVQLVGALVQSQGSTAVSAARDITLGSVTTSAALDATLDSGNYNRTSRSTEVGSTLQSAGNTTLTAGQNITARAADVQAAGNLTATAGNNLVIESGIATNSVASSRVSTNNGFLSSSTRTERQSTSTTTAIASNLGGQNIIGSSGQDLTIRGSTVTADKDINLSAANNLTIEAATNTQSSTRYSALSESGLMKSGSTGVSFGKRDKSTDTTFSATSAAASTVGSIGGNVSLSAGNTFALRGSDVLATGASTGNVTITAKKVDIIEARETTASATEQKFRQSGVTLSLESSVLQGAQTVQAMDQAMMKTKNDRMKALGAASAVMAARQATQSPSASVSLTVGTSSSTSTSTSTTDTARGSNVRAAGNINIKATGAGQDSNLTIQGSTVTAGDTVTLSADNQVQLLAAANTETQTSSQKSSSASAGISASTADKSIGFSGSASMGTGSGNGTDVSYTNTQIDAGKQAVIRSGGDTTLKGAVVTAKTIQAEVGGNLKVESLQDTSRFNESSQNAGGSATVGMGAGGSVSLAGTKIDSNYASVTQQSALRAGDGGFNVNVAGNTDLKGGAITSTDKAVNEGKNTFTTAKLTTSDIQNSASFSAESYAVTVGSKGGSAGMGQDSGSAASTTKAAVSGIAGNQAARTEDTETGIQKIFDANKTRDEVNAQVAITSEFGKQASKVIGDSANSQRKQLQEQIRKASTPEEKVGAEQAIKDVTMQERALNILVAALTGMAGSGVTKEALSTAADKMRDLMIQDSKEFVGAVDSTGKVLTNMSGPSDGIRGDGIKVGETRVDLDLLCGPTNERCKTYTDEAGTKQLALNQKGQVQFDDEAAGMGLEQFIATPQGQKMLGATGGIQGEKGTLFGVPYAAGSWQDKLIEAFSGTHDFVGGKLSGLYDEQGNASRGRSELTTTLQNRWSELAIIPSVPFAAAEGMSPEV
jgi:filamentous hemagglutinin